MRFKSCLLIPLTLCLAQTVSAQDDNLPKVVPRPADGVPIKPKVAKPVKEIPKPVPFKDVGVAARAKLAAEEPQPPKVGVAGELHEPVHHKPSTMHHIRLEDTPECAEEVKAFCSDSMKNNFMILDCLQDSEKTDEKVSDKCHHLLWNFKINMTMDETFDKALFTTCEAELNKISECKTLPKGKGEVIPCLVEHYEEIETPTCHNYINKMATIIFSDYRLMKPFIEDCSADIQHFGCGRLEGDEDDVHSQGKVVTCLHQKNVTAKCKHSLLRIAELQSEDYHMDRPLYYACRDDRQALCGEVVGGDGRIFKCLYKHLQDSRLSSMCKVKLEERQQMIAEDVKADMTFYEACKKDILQNKCAKKHHINDANGLDLEEDLKRTDILLCLENAENNGNKLDPSCVKEMFDMRAELVQDFKISPELVSACKSEIASFCGEGGLEPEGGSVHCLMKAAKDHHNQKEIAKTDNNTSHTKNTSHKHMEGPKFGHVCLAAVERLLHVVKPGDDIRMDLTLQRACGDVVSAACGDRAAGHGDIITCLLDNLDHDDMTDECEERLLEIQYFAVRDFQLDNHLFKQCRKDAKKICKLEFDEDSTTPERGPLVFSCLHRAWRDDHEETVKPSRGCIHEMRRVMRERGKRISLHPDVEAACLADLSEHCSDNEEHEEQGGEMECLQDLLEDLTAPCREQVSRFSEEEVEDIQLDRVLMKSCTPMIKKYCQDLLDSEGEPGQVLDCLIEHKHARDMDPKCAVGIEHHQIISSKMEIKFNKKFREHCKESVQKLCHGKKSKYEVVSCLSEHVRNDTLREARQRVPRPCQHQLKVELLHRSESIHLDPELEKACGRDVRSHCQDVDAGEGKVMECLKHHKKKLTPECHNKVFQRQQEQAAFGDYAFLHSCKRMIKAHCQLDASAAELLECLRKVKDDADFDSACRLKVEEREVEVAQDYRLDPILHKACKRDISKFCHDMKPEHPGEEMEGRVLNCLKKHFHTAKSPLSHNCEAEVRSRIKEAALDINQNPVVMKACQMDIKQLCKVEAGLDGVEHMSVNEEDGEEAYQIESAGAVIECLKKNFQKLITQNCKKEIAYMITEARVDVHVDPMLHKACTKELLSLCAKVPQGLGRQMSCLLANLETDPAALSRDCAGMLQRRKDLWEYAAQIAPAESLSELYDEIRLSPNRNYFFGVFFTLVGVIFIFGITCGRVTKRVRAEMKNK